MLITSRKILIMCLLVTAVKTAFANDLWLEVGRSPVANGNATSYALGIKNSPNFGIKFGLLTDSNFSNTFQDYPVPHSNYVNLGTKRVGNTYGMDIDYFFTTASAIKPYIGAGLYFGNRKNIAQSNVTGWYYNQGDVASTQISGEAGIQYKTENGFSFGAGYHSIRGGYLAIGKEF